MARNKSRPDHSTPSEEPENTPKGPPVTIKGGGNGNPPPPPKSPEVDG